VTDEPPVAAKSAPAVPGVG